MAMSNCNSDIYFEQLNFIQAFVSIAVSAVVSSAIVLCNISVYFWLSPLQPSTFVNNIIVAYGVHPIMQEATTILQAFCGVYSNVPPDLSRHRNLDLSTPKQRSLMLRAGHGLFSSESQVVCLWDRPSYWIWHRTFCVDVWLWLSPGLFCLQQA